MKFSKRQGDLPTPVLGNVFHHLPCCVASAHRTKSELILTKFKVLDFSFTLGDPVPAVHIQVLTQRSRIDDEISDG